MTSSPEFQAAMKAVAIEIWPDGCARSQAENGRILITPQMMDTVRRVVRAVILSIREPTDAMLVAANQPRRVGSADSDINAIRELMVARYQAMVDHILQEPTDAA